MCGRYTLKKRPDDIKKKVPFKGKPPAWQPRFNIAPTQYAPVITSEHNLTLMRWGLVPSWAKDPAIGNRMINARSETLHEKPAFKRLFKRRRCLIPADGFYEWKKVGSAKQPYHIRVDQGDVFAFAGLWDHWQSPEGDEWESFTIITTEANQRIQDIHHRMPVILPPDRHGPWLDTPETDWESLRPFLTALPEEHLDFFPVSTYVNSPAHDTPECVEPLETEASPSPSGTGSTRAKRPSTKQTTKPDPEPPAAQNLELDL